MNGYRVLRYIFLSFGRKWKPEIILTPTALLPKEEKHKNITDRSLWGSRTRSYRLGEKKNNFIMPGIETQSFDIPALIFSP